MGKSTLLKRIFIDIIENGYGIPIFIELRRLSSSNTILQEIYSQLNTLTKDFNKNLLLELFNTGGFIFLLDGYDEIALSERDSITYNIQDFIDKSINNKFILTSRPENALASFGNFQTTNIEPLKKKEAYELLRKYDIQGDISRSLIEKLKSGDYSIIDDFLQNPLLVSLLYTAFDYKQTIPLKKHIFYRQVYDALFNSHDISKGGSFTHEKRCNLDIDDFDRILRYIGFECIKQQKIEFIKDEFLKIIDCAKDYCCNIEFKSSDFLEDLLTSVPLFCKDGNYYKWSHKSLQEYFAALFIYKDVKNSQDLILTSIYKSSHLDKYSNLLDLYYDIDLYGFRKNILLPFLKLYKQYIKGFDKDTELNKRKGLLFLRKIFILIGDRNITLRERIDEFLKLGHTFEFAQSTFSTLEVVSFECPMDDYVKRILIPILSSKKSPLLIQYNSIVKDESLLILKSEKYIEIDCNKNSFINTLISHKIINSIIADLNKSSCYYIDYNKCLNEIEKIESEILLNENSTKLLEGL